MDAKGDKIPVPDSDSGAGAPLCDQRCPSAGDMAAGSPKEAFLTDMPNDGDVTVKHSAAGKTVEEFQGTLTEGAEDDEENRDLLLEAEERAAQQEMARRTMLTLADVLEELTKEKRQLVKQLDEERKSTTALKAGWAGMAAELERVNEEHERSLARELVQKAEESGNRMLYPMLLEQSRQGFPSSLFGPNTADGPSRIRWQDLHDGDRITIKWLLRSWLREAKAGKKGKAEEAAKKERLKMEEEARLKIQAEATDNLEQWKRRSVELERRLAEAGRKQREMETQCGHQEEEVAKVRIAQENEKKLLVQAQEELSHELASVRTVVMTKEVQIQNLMKEREQERAANKLKEKEAELEISRLKEKIRKITGELEQAVILARHMRETALKAKRDAAKSVSTEKFAQLVVQLEELRDKLDVTTKDNEHLRGDRGWLQDKLDKNQRRLELERQFLPLVHGARGPLGVLKDPPKREKESAIDARAGPPGSRFAAATDKTELPASKSMPQLPGIGGPRGGIPLGSPLGASH